MDDDCALTQFDARLAASLHEHAHASPATVAILTTLTTLGSTTVLTSLAIAVALLLAWRGEYTLSRIWGIVFAGCLLNDALKLLFQRHRPHFPNPLIVEASWSFPSGHAMSSFIGYGLLAYLLCRVVPHPKVRTVTVAGTVMLILVVGFSRLYLGAHYFSDVIGGYAAGAVWLSGSISGIEMLQRSGRLKLFRHHSTPVVPQPQSVVESA